MSETENSQPQVQDKFTFLASLTAKRKHHGNKSFHQHLHNVYRYLKSEGLPEEVCDAGLFHAIYGTEFYSFQNTSVTREKVRGYIGPYAEELAFIFCNLRNRFRSIVDNIPSWSPKQHLDLCWIEYANLWDHREFKDVSQRLSILSETIQRITPEVVAVGKIEFLPPSGPPPGRETNGVTAKTGKQIDFLPPPYPPRLLNLEEVTFLSQNGWLPLDLSDNTESAFRNVLEEVKAFFDLDIEEKQGMYGARSATENGYYTVPEEKEYMTFRYQAYPSLPLEYLVGVAWNEAARLLHRILCDLAVFNGFDPRMWDQFLEDTSTLPQKHSSGKADNTTFMRIFQYHPEKGVAEAHADLGLLTLCIGTDSGLEVLDHTSEGNHWEAPEKGQAVVLVGRMASQLLHKHARPGQHRVVANPKGRRSAVFALRPCLRAEGAREYWTMISQAHHNVNATKELREQQRDGVKRLRDQQLNGAFKIPKAKEETENVETMR